MKYITEKNVIIFDPSFNEELNLSSLPTNYNQIIFSDYNLNYNLFEAFENNNFVYFEYLRSDFDQPVSNLPYGITHLTFGFHFNQSVSNLPYGISHLTFGECFNQPVDALPPTITHLTFNMYSIFNHTISNIPTSITHLSLGQAFNQPVDNIPSSITHLTIGILFNQSISNLPSSIQYLTLGCDLPISNLPFSIRNLTLFWYFNHPVDALPYSITHLTFDDGAFNQPIDLLPSSITHLTFGHYSMFNQSLNNLPINLEYIELSPMYKNKILNIPPKLSAIKCSTKYAYINDFNDLTGLKVISY